MKVVSYLRAPQLLQQQIDTAFSQPVVDALPNTPLLFPDEAAIESLCWSHDIHGQSFKDGDVNAVLTEGLQADRRFIRGFSKQLSSLTHGRVPMEILAGRLKLFSLTPAWGEVEKAPVRLDGLDPSGQGYAGMVQDGAIVSEYGAMLRRNTQTVAQALIIGAFLSRLSPAPENDRLLD